ncbi:ROK family transcriptional regulator [Moritella sp. 24]|uniref:ROK family transcriptional regulator n=1 Tax=Moritella sp. 24 TaxID=2746230 RepID=UPI001BABB96C|nr:ROK family transcriptional regulator [Moritella sp. 24]QUM76768.1 ROK family transcriptional regulator [Moritella sp. 24]
MPNSLLSNTQRQILSHVYAYSPITRAELAEKSGLTPAAITKITKTMIDEGWINTLGRLQSQRGQPGIALGINGDKGFSLGINIEVEKISIEMINLNAESVFSKSLKGIFEDPIYSRDELFSLLDVLRLAYPNEFAHLVGVGITTSCNFIEGDKVIYPKHLKQWESLNIRDELSKYLNTDVWLENDGNAAALGEFIYDRKPLNSNHFYLYLGYGIGGGHLHNGVPYRGHYGNAGRIGKLFPLKEHRPSLNNLYKQLGLTEINPMRYQALLTELEKNNPIIDTWAKNSIPSFKQAILAIKTILDPQEIIIGGLIPQGILDKIYHELEHELQDLKDDDEPLLKVSFAKLAGDKSAAIGAAALPLYKKIFEYI